ncbi:MAG: hypothetical protein AB1345_14165 [Chloroflexota bacterium]
MNMNKILTVILFPIVLSVGIVLIPVVPDYSNHSLAAQAVGQTGRWVAGHLLAAVAFGLSMWSTSVIAVECERLGSKVPVFIMLLLSAGGGLYAAGLGADGIGPTAVKATGASPLIFFEGSGWWVTGVFMTATLFFGVGLILLVVYAIRGRVVVGVWRYIVFISALIFVSAPAIPSGWALYGVAFASLGVFLPIGLSIRRAD